VGCQLFGVEVLEDSHGAVVNEALILFITWPAAAGSSRGAAAGSGRPEELCEKSQSAKD